MNIEATVCKLKKTDMVGRSVRHRGVAHIVVSVVSMTRFTDGYSFGAAIEAGYRYVVTLRPATAAENAASAAAKQIAELLRQLESYQREPDDFRDRDMYASQAARLESELAALRT